MSILRRARRKCDDRGQTVLEYVGVVPMLIFIGLLVVQLGLALFAVQQAGTSARAAARVASYDLPGCQQAGHDALSSWLSASFDCRPGSDEVTVTAHVRIPSLIPGLLGGAEATRSATMPKDGP